jgi:hypothetical protein
LDFNAIGGKRQGFEVPQSLEGETGCEALGLENQIKRSLLRLRPDALFYFF